MKQVLIQETEKVSLGRINSFLYLDFIPDYFPADCSRNLVSFLEEACRAGSHCFGKVATVVSRRLIDVLTSSWRSCLAYPTSPQPDGQSLMIMMIL